MTRRVNVQPGQAGGRMPCGEASKPPVIVDCDVHAKGHPTDRVFRSYLARRWQEYYDLRGLHLGNETQIPLQREFAHRADTVTPDGRPPGTDPAFARQQLLETHGIAAAIVNNQGETLAAGSNHPTPFTLDIVRANNDWICEQWIASDSRWRPTINVAQEIPIQAAREIRRCRALSSNFVGVYLSSRSEQPAGNPRYWPVFEAATDLDMPVVYHVGNTLTSQITGCGMPNYYYENHAGYAQQVFTVVASLIFEGVLERFPTLRVVLAELGWTWALAFARRLDTSWRVMREEVPHLSKAPSEYLREHFWYTTQPVEEPPVRRWFKNLVSAADEFGLVDRLMYSSDYPHWDFDPPEHGVPRGVFSESMRLRVLGGNAVEAFRLEGL